MMKPPAASIDDYLAKLPPDQRAALETLRGQIRKLAPEAEEAISYGLPTFKLKGNLVHFGAAAKHCAFYPGAVISQFAERLKGFETAKGTIRFQPDAPLPPDLIRDIVQHRIAENLEIAAERAARKKR
ncbi:iron chaperone [Caulobacter segnis]